MSEVLIKEYSHLLTKEESVNLFDKLIQYYGSRIKASKECKVIPKTTYNWLKTLTMRAETKRKILRKFIEAHPEEAFDLMAKKSVESSINIIYLLLSHSYENIFFSETNEEINKSIQNFENMIEKYEGIIQQHMSAEILDMRNSIKKLSSEEINISESIPTLIKIEDFCDTLPYAMKEISSYPEDVYVNKISTELKYPIQLITAISETVQEIQREVTRPEIKLTITPEPLAGTAKITSCHWNEIWKTTQPSGVNVIGPICQHSEWRPSVGYADRIMAGYTAFSEGERLDVDRAQEERWIRNV